MSSRADTVPAWLLAEGDVLPGPVTVLSVQREVVGRTVRVCTSEMAVAELPADAPVEVVRRTR